MDKIHIQRLEAMIGVLKDVEPEAFCLASWDCGTTACAVGHYDRRFPEEIPKFRGISHWEGVEKYFGINSREAQWLFSKHEYERGDLATSEEVIERIQNFIEFKILFLQGVF